MVSDITTLGMVLTVKATMVTTLMPVPDLGGPTSVGLPRSKQCRRLARGRYLEPWELVIIKPVTMMEMEMMTMRINIMKLEMEMVKMETPKCSMQQAKDQVNGQMALGFRVHNKG